MVPVSRGRRGAHPDEDDTAELPELPLRTPSVPEPRQAVSYPWPETPATGLRKFNLGTIPASVTPPRTWLRAAWFAVGTGMFVVLALGFAAFQLMGNPKKVHTIDALPGQPSQHLLITDLPADTPDNADEAAPTSVRTTEPKKSSSARPTKATSHADRPAGGGEGRPDQPGMTTDPPGTVDPGPVPPTTAPARSTVEPAPMPPTDPEQLGDRTEMYYAQVCQNPDAAYQLTTGPMRAEGPGGIEARYGNVDRIEVQQIMIDPNWSFTRSRLTVVREDGSTVTIERELTFTHGPDPKISTDTRAG